MRRARQEIAEMIASVVTPPSEPGDVSPDVTLSGWVLQKATQSESWTAVSFRAGGRTETQAFDRDVTVAVHVGRVEAVFASGEKQVAEPGTPVLIPASHEVSLVPSEGACGVLLFSPPIKMVQANE